MQTVGDEKKVPCLMTLSLRALVSWGRVLVLNVCQE
jgi:hypothetical protein